MFLYRGSIHVNLEIATPTSGLLSANLFFGIKNSKDVFLYIESIKKKKIDNLSRKYLIILFFHPVCL